MHDNFKLTPMEMVSIISENMTDYIDDKINKKELIEKLNNRFSVEDLRFKFFITKSTCDENWVSIVLPRFGNKENISRSVLGAISVDINESLFKYRDQGVTIESVSAVVVSTIIQNAFNLVQILAMKDFLNNINDNPLFHDRVLGKEEAEGILFNKFPLEAMYLFAFPDIFDVECDDLLEQLLIFKKRSLEISKYNERYDKEKNEAFVLSTLNYIFLRILNRSQDIHLALNFSTGKRGLSTLELRASDIDSELINVMENRNHLFKNYNTVNFLKKYTDTSCMMDFLTESVFDIVKSKFKPLKIARDIDQLLIEVEDIRTMSDKQALIDVIYDKISYVNKHLKSGNNQSNSLAKNYLAQLYDLIEMVKEAKIKKRTSIITINYPEGYEG